VGTVKNMMIPFMEMKPEEVMNIAARQEKEVG
jgi:hypothetical protein